MDSIILGGGIIGCALAEELARRGQRVVLVERGAIGAEASAAAAGIISAQMDLTEPGPLFELCQASRRMYPAWVRRLERCSGLSVSYHEDGILYLALSQREARTMERQARWQRARGLRVERWSKALVRRREPAVDGRLVCSFHFPTEGQVDNVVLMQALAASARRAGARVLDSTAVRGLLRRGRSVRGVETTRGMLRAPVVVNCLGSWADMGGRFPVKLPVEPARGQIVVFRGPRRLLRHIVMSTRGYVVQRRDGRLIMGSTVERVGFEKALTLDGMHGILCGIRQMASTVDRCHFVEAWAGFRPYTPDRLPILGATRIDGLYVATGHFRHGILLAPVTAELMADLILQGRATVDLSPFSPARFR